MRAFMLAVFLMGVIRFALTLAGIPDSTVKYFSMTALIIADILFFSVRTQTHKERFIAAYLLIFPYMIVEVAALSYTCLSGRHTIFQTDHYSFGFPIGIHTLRHFIGGLTWEPWGVFLLMEVLWGISRLFRLTSPS